MACSGAHCTNHSTGTTTCAGHRPQSSPTGPAVAAPAVGVVVTAAKINELRSAIVTEVSRWTWHGGYVGVVANGNWTTVTSNIAVGTVVDDDSTVDSQEDSLIYVGASWAPGYALRGNPATRDVNPALANVAFTQGVDVTVANYNTILARYNALRMDCICNSDCACNAVCACHNNCGCNYSDKRLKMEIFYC